MRNHHPQQRDCECGADGARCNGEAASHNEWWLAESPLRCAYFGWVAPRALVRRQRRFGVLGFVVTLVSIHGGMVVN
jgi:hypothetical protein